MKIYFFAALVLLTQWATAQETEEQVKLRADIISQRYCEVDRRTNSLLVKFKIRLTNTRNPALSFYQNPYPVLLVAGTQADLLKHRYEFQLHAPDVFGSINDPPRPRPVPRALRAGEELESETMEITVPTPRTSRLRRYEALSVGIHYIQLRMDLQVEGRQLTFVRATSQPLAIKVERNNKPQKCQ
jgi:hypothetical protein